MYDIGKEEHVDPSFSRRAKTESFAISCLSVLIYIIEALCTG